MRSSELTMFLSIVFLAMLASTVNALPLQLRLNLTSNDTHITLYDNTTLLISINRTSNYSDNSTNFLTEVQTNFSTSNTAVCTNITPRVDCGDTIITPPACNPTINVPPSDTSANTAFVNTLNSLTTACLDAVNQPEQQIQVPQITTTQEKQNDSLVETAKEYWLFIVILVILVAYVLNLFGFKDRIKNRDVQPRELRNTPERIFPELEQHVVQSAQNPPSRQQFLLNQRISTLPSTDEVLKRAKSMAFGEEVLQHQLTNYEQQSRDKSIEVQKLNEQLIKRDAQMDALKRMLEKESVNKVQLKDDMEKTKKELSELMSIVKKQEKPKPVGGTDANFDFDVADS